MVDVPARDGASTADRIRGLVEADPVVLVEIAGAIANEGRMPPDAVTALAQEHLRGSARPTRRG